MIQSLEIHNFKSIRHLILDCRRVNVFIGEPNTGKSNILESLGVFSVPFTGDLGDFVRLRNVTDLFYNNNLQEEITIRAGKNVFRLCFNEQENRVQGTMELEPFPFPTKTGMGVGGGSVCFDGRKIDWSPAISLFRFYRFSPKVKFQETDLPFLAPPYGKNLPFLLTNQELWKSLSDLFAPFLLKQVVIRKKLDELAVFLPYSVIPDVLRQTAFYLVAIETNQNAILIFEEPDFCASSYYAQHLADVIARDHSNQFFFATHNPEFLIAVLEKVPANELAVFLTYFKNGQTMTRSIAGKKELETVLDLDIADVFLNLHLFVEEEP